jgi:restriction endonuclease S subunit
MKVKLGDIAQLQFGFYSKQTEKGEAAYLQAKHFDDLGKYTGEIDTFIHIDEKSKSHLLEDGDIILAGKGMRNFAWTYQKNFGPAIASSIFFVIKPNRSKVLPEFLTTLFNLHQTQTFFQNLGAGSSIPSIRKSELEAFTFVLPTLDRQQKAINIQQLYSRDMELSHLIISEKQKIYQAVIKNIIYHNYE